MPNPNTKIDSSQNFPPIDTQILTQLGVFHTWWARIEYLLGIDLLQLMRHPIAPSQAGYTKVERHLKKRIKQWACLHITILGQENTKAKNVTIVENFLRTSTTYRHDITHSFWTDDPKNPRKAKLMNMKEKKGRWTLSTFYVSELGLKQRTARLRRAYDEMIILMTGLALSGQIPDPASQRIAAQAKEWILPRLTK
jgi:hypothetical protein